MFITLLAIVISTQLFIAMVGGMTMELSHR